MDKCCNSAKTLDPIELNNKKILDEINEAKSTFKINYNNLEHKIYSYIESIEKKITKFDSIEKEIANIFAINNVKSEKIEEILLKISSIETKNLNHYCSFNILQKEFIETKNKLDKMYLNNLCLPGHIGECCKFKNLKDFLMFVIDKFHELDLYKDLNKEKLKSYDKKISTLLTQFKITENAVKDVIFDYTNHKIDPMQQKFENMQKEINEKASKMQMENMLHLIEVKNETEKVKKVKSEIEENKNQISNDISCLFKKIDRLNKIVKNLTPDYRFGKKFKKNQLSNNNINSIDNDPKKNFAFLTESNNKVSENLKRAASITSNDRDIVNFYSKQNKENFNKNERKSKNSTLNFLNIDNNNGNCINKNYSGNNKNIGNGFSSNSLLIISENDKSSNSFLFKDKNSIIPNDNKNSNTSSSSSSYINEEFNNNGILKDNSSINFLGEKTNYQASIKQMTPNKEKSNDSISNNVNKSMRYSIEINLIDENKINNIENNTFYTKEANSLNVSKNESSKFNNKLNIDKNRKPAKLKSPSFNSKKNGIKKLICTIPSNINNIKTIQKLPTRNGLIPIVKSKSSTSINKNKKNKQIAKIENKIKNSTFNNDKKNVKNLFFEKMQELNPIFNDNITKNLNDSMKQNFKFRKSFNDKDNTLNGSIPKTFLSLPNIKKSKMNRKKSNNKLNEKEKKQNNSNLSLIAKPVNFKKTEKINI